MSDLDTPTPDPAPPPAPSQPDPTPTNGGPDAEERQWAMFAHLSALVAGLLTSFIIGGAGCFLGPLIIWLVKKDTMPFVADQAKEALNFNIIIAIVMFGLLALTFLSLFLLSPVTVPLMIVVGLGALVLTIIAAIKANEGVAYRYPFNIRFIK